jgi:hypothetical protein
MWYILEREREREREKRKNDIRLKEYLKHIRSYQIYKSSLAAHVWDKGHNVKKYPII